MKETLELLKEILQQLKEMGFSIPLILVVVIAVVIIAYADNLEKLKRLLILPFYRLGRWGSRAYIAKSVALPVASFLNKQILPFIDNVEHKKVRIKIDYVRNKEELKKKSNTYVVRFRETDDQARNILTAANVVIPSLICPLVRPNIDSNLSKAIDLTVLRKLAVKLGRHGRIVFQKTFLNPELDVDPTINHFIQELIRIDRKGLFISIFASELQYLGEETFLSSDRSNRTADVLNFLQFLIKIAEREIGEMHQLDFHSDSINVGIILLAKSEKADAFGVTPYLNRLRMKFSDGSEHVYIISFPPASAFLRTLLSAINNDIRWTVADSYKIEGFDGGEDGSLTIALVKANPSFANTNFVERSTELGLAPGKEVSAIVTEVSRERAVINCLGLNCFISKNECSWYTTLSCSNELDSGERYQFLIKDVNMSTESIELTRRFETEDPWRNCQIPSPGDVVEITIHVPYDMHFVGRTDDGLEIKVPMTEVVWGEMLEDDRINLIGQKLKAKILFVQPENRLIRASLRALTPDPWAEIKGRFPPGTKVLGTVVAIDPQFVTLELSKGVHGRLPKSSLVAAGHEYRDFETNLMIGQKLSVEVNKVWTQKQKISLELSRNLETRALPVPPDYVEEKEHRIVKMKPLPRKRR